MNRMILMMTMLTSSVFAVNSMKEALAKSSLFIALVGDSTVADYDSGKTAQRGWGQLLPSLFKPSVRITNLAVGGRSTKTFFSEGRWAKALDLKPDLVLIQFGHNDGHGKDKPESTDAATDYRDNLERYVQEAREAGIFPILVTPMARRIYRPDGKIAGELKPYVEAMATVAARTGTPCVDLFGPSVSLFESLGDAGSVDLCMPKDRTHFTEKGARMMAAMVRDGLVRLEGDWRRWLEER